MFIPTLIVSLFLLYAGLEGFHSKGMYTLLRISVCAISVMTAFKYYEKEQQTLTWIFVVIAVIFNPFVEIHFYRRTWENIDVITAIIFAVSAYFTKQENRS